MNKKVLLTLLTTASLSLTACGSSNNDDSSPTTPTTPPITDAEKLEAEQVAKFFLNAISPETLNRGLIDRVLYLQDEILGDACKTQVTNTLTSYTLNSACSIAYDVAETFEGVSGSFSSSGDPADNTGLNNKLNNLVLKVGGEKFTFNGTINIKEITDGEVHSSDDLVITSQTTGSKFSFKNFKLTILYSGSPIKRNSSGELTVTDQDNAELYAVTFSQDTDWSSSDLRSNPTLGTLKIQFKNDSSRYLTLTASSNSNIATYYAQTDNYTIADNISKNWTDIIISPALYSLP